MILVSACLVGVRSRYDSGAKKNKKIIAALKGKAFLAVCPEQLGGFPTPRPRCHFICGDGRAVLQGKARVMNADGLDVTENFIRGAKEVLHLARLTGSKLMIGVEKSPSCGISRIDCEGKLISGEGVTTALLRMNGIKVREKL